MIPFSPSLGQSTISLASISVFLLSLQGACTKVGATSTPDRAVADQPTTAPAQESTTEPGTTEPTAEEAISFVDQANQELKRVWTEAESKNWEMATNITPETEAAAAAASVKAMEYVSTMISQAQRFKGLAVDADTQRKLHLIQLATILPSPNDDAKRKELATLSTEMSSIYGKGKHCVEKDGQQNCRDLGQLSEVLANNRDYATQLEAWQGWRSQFQSMRPLYKRFVELSNEGAKELGFSDTGELWRSQYDMNPESFSAEMERLWGQVKPLYDALHCHVRAKLAKKYGKDKVDPKQGLIPAHILGNMWSQDWSNLYPMLEPYRGQPSIDVSGALQKSGKSATDMVKMAEGFFTSLGLDPLPDTFWQRSMFEKPKDRDVVCHASAWDLSYNNDLRIKMCIKPTMEDFVTIHHELGHNYYYHAYYKLPVLYQAGAHDGFHEGIGDTLALSVTPAYLKQVGLLKKYSDSKKALLNKQMQTALQKIAFLPFGLLIDRWRWDVFSGKTSPDKYNEAWWQLREQYQGIKSPVARSEQDFDPGAKYHIPGNTPYARYFLAAILQFQFHRSLCQVSGHEGPLHTCSIYGSAEAGRKLQSMLAMGASRPWPDALEAITGAREMDASALIEYFSPLMKYLEKQNRNRSCGWSNEG